MSETSQEDGLVWVSPSIQEPSVVLTDSRYLALMGGILEYSSLTMTRLTMSKK